MLRHLLNQPKANYFKQSPSVIQWLVISMFVLVIALEFSTPPPYVFGYLYIGAVLLTSARLGRRATILVTSVAVTLTILNLVIPGLEPVTLATVANRLIAVIALIVTGWLSDRNRYYEEAIIRQQMKLLAQEELAQVREDFASTLTHDLKTPLLGAIETLTAFRQEKFGPITVSQRKVLDIMSRSHQTTLQLVETLLDVYRNDTEGLQLQCQPVDLVKVAEEAIATLTNLASARQIQIRLTFDDSNFRRSLWVHGDMLQLQRVFVNLISNAIYHSLRGKKVEVVMASRDTTHVVKVIDNGQGISKNDLPLLFERFYQGSGDRQPKGSGLGLYLSRQIIEAHGGTIWAEQHLPQGATFGFRLPAYLANASPVAK
ncbi:sensor histidine kinase [Leptolyngbya sp. AN02str]|uniref:sensor histidine kinase n=1 Tax=Leptolyngbya sp. AN02str TaxID=3423363 RepID=UPI003D313CA3